MSSKFFKLCCVGIFLCCILVGSQAAKSLEVTSFVSSSKYDSSWIDWQTVRLTKMAPNTFVISGDATLNYNFGNEQMIEVKVLRKNRVTNNYASVFSLNKPACKLISTDEVIYPTLLDHSNLPPADTCPIPKGDYKVVNFTFDAEKIPNSFPSGEYKLLLTFSDGHKGVAGLEMELVLSAEK